MRKPKAEKPRPAGTPSAYVFRAVLRSPLGFRHLEPESGKTLDGEVAVAMDGLCAERDDVFEITIRRAPRKEGA